MPDFISTPRIQSMGTAIGTRLKAIFQGSTLTEADDLNNLPHKLQYGGWSSNRKPANAPDFNTPGVFQSVPASNNGSGGYQIVTDRTTGDIYHRAFSTDLVFTPFKKLNERAKYAYYASGRAYMYNDNRWTTPHDDIYGQMYYQNAESGSSTPDPVQEWEHMGLLFEQGQTVHGLNIYGRITDATNLSDMELMVTFTSDIDGNWDSIGIDNDSEDEHTTLFRDFWINPQQGIYPAATTDINDQYLRKIPLNFTAPRDGQLRIYFKPVEVVAGDTNNDYFYHSRKWILSEAV